MNKVHGGGKKSEKLISIPRCVSNTQGYIHLCILGAKYGCRIKHQNIKCKSKWHLQVNYTQTHFATNQLAQQQPQKMRSYGFNL